MADKVMNVFEAEGFPMAPEGGSDKFGATVVPVGKPLGLRGLGAMFVTVEPGMRGFPYHNHLGNDEMFVILEGAGTYRMGGEELPVGPGSVCGAPRGGPDTAHQIINTGDVPLRYLGISTMRDPEICEYPDSGKFAAISVFPGKDFMSAHMRHVGKPEDARDYWDGEDT